MPPPYYAQSLPEVHRLIQMCVLMGIAASQSLVAVEPPAHTSMRLAVMRGTPEKWALDANFAIFLKMIEKASNAKAELFVTPECWLDGYAAADKTSTPDKLRTIAQNLDTSPYLKRVADEARNRTMTICFGFTSEENGKLFNAAGLWGNDGHLIGVYHKTHLQEHDLKFSPGEALPVWPTPWGPIGIMICADRRWPETARTLRLKGAKLILNPSYGMHGDENEMWMRTRSCENQCFIAFAHPSVSLVVDPKGNVAAKKKGGKPNIVVCDVNLLNAKDDNHLKDRRPELYGIITEPNDRK